MRFQIKLLLTYSILILLLVVTLGIGFLRYSARAFEENAFASLSVISEKISQQLDNLIRPMDSITTYLLSNRDFMSSMASLAVLDRSDPRNLLYINEGWRTINGALLSYSVGKDFYSVNVFNEKGDFLSSNFNTHSVIPDVHKTITGLAWVGRADRAMGRALLLTPYVDPWAQDRDIKVFGLARSVQGPKGGMGYLEVQNPYADLQKVFSVPERENIAVAAVSSSGELFYSSVSIQDELVRYYDQFTDGAERRLFPLRNPVTGRQEIVVGASSEYTGINVVLSQDMDALLRPLVFTRTMTILIGALIVAFSFTFNLLSSRQLTMPLRRLKASMERTELDNLPETIALESANDEIEALNISFQRLRGRLNEAVRREIESQSLHMQARFDSLQAQVNPHFIYNVLTVLSNRGMEAGDEEICKICDGIASMLRYSTSTLTRAATVGEEIEHVRTYLFLMKKRFEHRLEFDIEVDPALVSQVIPKIVLQQIVENSINHGFQALQTDMKISIQGSIDGGRPGIPASSRPRPSRLEARSARWQLASGERWRIRIADNGQGFDGETLLRLRRGIEEVKASLAHGEGRGGFAIGGMGLLSTYARLLLFYGSDVEFALENGSRGGAIVSIGALLGGTGHGDGSGPDSPDRG